MATTFTGEGFLKAMTEGRLREPIIKVGMVKKNDAEPDSILFVEGAQCGNWISLPLSIIEEVTFLMNVGCKDHKHPLVQIQFKEPAEEDHQARAFAALARTTIQPGPTSTGGTTGPTGPQTADVKPEPGGYNGPKLFGGLTCIAWSNYCRWVDLWVNGINRSVPIFVCTEVCYRYGLE